MLKSSKDEVAKEDSKNKKGIKRPRANSIKEN